MGVIGTDLGAQIKAELAASGESLDPKPADPAPATPSAADPKPAAQPSPKATEHDGATDADEELDAKPEGDEGEGETSEPQHLTIENEFDPALDEVIEYNGQKATIRELFEAQSQKFAPERLNELTEGLMNDRAEYQQAAKELGELASLRRRPREFFTKTAEIMEAEGLMPAGSAETVAAWFQDLVQSGAIDLAKIDREALQQDHERALQQREAQYTERLTTMEAQADMTAIIARYGQLSKSDLSLLKAEVARAVAQEEPGERLVARTFKKLLDAGKIKPNRAQPSPLRVADRIRRVATDRRSNPNTKTTPLTDDELESAVNRSLLK